MTKAVKGPRPRRTLPVRCGYRCPSPHPSTPVHPGSRRLPQLHEHATMEALFEVRRGSGQQPPDPVADLPELDAHNPLRRQLTLNLHLVALLLQHLRRGWHAARHGADRRRAASGPVRWPRDHSCSRSHKEMHAGPRRWRGPALCSRGCGPVVRPSVELGGIEPPSSSAETGLLRVQSVVSFSRPRRSY